MIIEYRQEGRVFMVTVEDSATSEVLDKAKLKLMKEANAQLDSISTSTKIPDGAPGAMFCTSRDYIRPNAEEKYKK